MGKGVLLELEGRQAIVLTPQGEFKRVPVPAGTWEIGDEIEFAETQPSRWMLWAKVGAVAAAVFLAVLAPWAYGSLYLPAQVMAVVTIDINPSLELGVNHNGDVIQAQGLNADGEALLQVVNWKGRPLADVVTEVTEQAIAAQKLNPTDDSGAVLVAVAPAGSKELPEATADQLAVEARTAAEVVVAAKAEAQGETPRAHVSALKASAAEKAEAEKTGLNPGQYMLWKEIQAAAPTVEPEDVKAKGPGALMKELGLSPSDLFRRAEEHAGPKSGDKSKPGNGNQGQKSRTGFSPDDNVDDDSRGTPGPSDQGKSNGTRKGSEKDSDKGPDQDRPKDSGQGRALSAAKEQEMRERERQAQLRWDWERRERERKEQERKELERREQERREQERKEQERKEQERKEQERKEQERKEQERKEQERKDQERKEQERKDQERKGQNKQDGGQVGENGNGRPDPRATQPGVGPLVPAQRPRTDAGREKAKGDQGAPDQAGYIDRRSLRGS